MIFLSEEKVEKIRAEYPPGTRVTLLRMDDSQAPPIGTQGTVKGVDDTGSLLMSWDSGSSLNVIYGEDYVEKVPEIAIRMEERQQAQTRRSVKPKGPRL